MRYKGNLGEYIELSDRQTFSSFEKGKLPNGILGLLWFQESVELKIDGQVQNVRQNEVVPITEYQDVDDQKLTHTKILAFNRSFYCILDHDQEVGCKGLLYFGASTPPKIHFKEDDLHILNTVWTMLEIEMRNHDNLQLEMLQAMLKRLLIHVTRVYKKQGNLSELQVEEVELIRAYNYLVEENFRTNMKVADYAKMLHRSPKTLANHFKKMGKKTPLEFIHDRKMIEARRLLSFTDKQISEIAYEIGFEDVHAFSKFFKKKQGVSPSEFAKGNF